jgi:hypothetical protein
MDFAQLTTAHGPSTLLDSSVASNTYEHYIEHRQWIEDILHAR